MPTLMRSMTSPVARSTTEAVALSSFAALLEGYVFAPLVGDSLVLIVPATVAIFYPDFTVEAAGLVTLIAVLGFNAWQGRRHAATA